ncbi:MAG: hypothetical protein N2Z79_02735, partial [Candidatus Omnitrophica bacterium]|nr:hypothetical protein [Candidatus Omnitrophota bacterium]
MREKNKPLLVLEIIFILFFLPYIGFSQIQNIDEANLELELACRLETMIEKLIGRERALVKVDVSLHEKPMAKETFSFKSSVRGIPSIVIPEKKESSGLTAVYSQIKSILVVIYLDNRLPQEKVELVKTNVIKWLELDFSRGDGIKIELIPWKEVSPEDVEVKQLSFLKRNLWLIIIIASVLIVGTILTVFLVMKMQRSFKEGLSLKTEEKPAIETSKIESTLEEIKNTLIKSAGIPQRRTEELLEDIRELMTKFPKRSDAILEEIKETLQKASLTQVSVSSGVGISPGTSPTSSDFLTALREVFNPLISSEGRGGTGITPEVAEILKKIETTLKESAAERADELD